MRVWESIEFSEMSENEMCQFNLHHVDVSRTNLTILTAAAALDLLICCAVNDKHRSVLSAVGQWSGWKKRTRRQFRKIFLSNYCARVHKETGFGYATRYRLCLLCSMLQIQSVFNFHFFSFYAAAAAVGCHSCAQLHNSSRARSLVDVVVARAVLLSLQKWSLLYFRENRLTICRLKWN